MRAESDDWVKVLPKIIEGLNEAPTSALLGKSPDEVEEDDVAVFDLQKENARKALESQEKQLRQKYCSVAPSTHWMSLCQYLNNRHPLPNRIALTLLRVGTPA